MLNTQIEINHRRRFIKDIFIIIRQVSEFSCLNKYSADIQLTYDSLKLCRKILNYYNRLEIFFIKNLQKLKILHIYFLMLVKYFHLATVRDFRQNVFRPNSLQKTVSKWNSSYAYESFN